LQISNVRTVEACGGMGAEMKASPECMRQLATNSVVGALAITISSTRVAWPQASRDRRPTEGSRYGPKLVHRGHRDLGDPREENPEGCGGKRISGEGKGPVFPRQ